MLKGFERRYYRMVWALIAILAGGMVSIVTAVFLR